MSSTIFYNDEHAARLLKSGPRFVNVYVFTPTGAYIHSGAHGTRDIADSGLKATRSRVHNLAYRIVVRLKPSVAE
jgi:hypothetical protein